MAWRTHNGGLARECGFSLVELMVAIAIGLVVTTVALQGYVSGLQVQSTQNDMARQNESARFAFMLLTAEIEKAGFRDSGTGTGGYFGKSFGKGGELKYAGSPVYVVDGANGASADNNYSDTLIVNFYGENNFATPTTDTADGKILDCLGNPIARDMWVQEKLYIDKDAANNNELSLFCQTTYHKGTEPGSAAPPACATVANADGSKSCAAVALIPGVVAMKLVYGTDLTAPTGDSIVNSYMSLGNVTNKDNILSVMASLIVRTTGVAPASVDTATHTIHHFSSDFVWSAGDVGKTFTVPADGKIYVPFTSTIALRNYGHS